MSRHANRDDPVLKTGSIGDVFAMLKPETSSPLFSPLLWADEEGRVAMGHKNLPKAYFQVAGMDMLRDDALIYERILREEFGIPTKLDLYAGFGHMFCKKGQERVDATGLINFRDELSEDEEELVICGRHFERDEVAPG